MEQGRTEVEETAATHAVPEAADEAQLTDDPELVPARPQSLRTVAARGTIVNSAFEIGLSALGTVKRLAVAAFLTRSEFGLWGIILSILVTLSWLKQLGVADKYIQQDEPDQEAAFQKAFTLELLASTAFLVLVALVLPLYGLAYGHLEIVLPGMVLALSIPLSAWETPSWIPYRRMQYARHRTLAAVDPVTSLVATIALGAAGLGYWALVAGVMIGTVAGSVVCTVTSPYRLRFRFSRTDLREYASFSLPLFGSGVSRLVVVQGSLLVANHKTGLAGLGAIGLATSIATFADRVDGIVSGTIYPAVCRVVDRLEALREAFVKSNRVALMWAMPFAAALALFAADFVHFVIGDRWQPAVGLLATFGLTCGLGQVAFNWAVFMRAVNRTRPIFVGAVLDLGVFFVVSIPAMLLFGLPGYAAGFVAATAVQVAVRGYYMRRLLPGFNVIAQLVRGVAPVVPGSLLVLLARTVAGGERTLTRALSELVLFAATTIAMTFLLERPLIRELVGYLRRPARQPAPATG